MRGQMRKRREYRVGICSHCRVSTKQTLEWQYRRWEGNWKDVEDSEHRSYYVARCEECKEVLLYVNNPPHDDICDVFEGSVEADTVLAWPELAVAAEAVPQHIRECYDEAVGVRGKSLNAFAITIRRALEAICNDKAIPKGNLSNRLQTLSFNVELMPQFKQMTDVLRSIGNIGAHADRNVTKAEAEIVDRFFRLLIEYFYDVPQRMAELKEIWAKISAAELLIDDSELRPERPN